MPFVGGNSDMGFGGGYIASLARVEPQLEPYRWRVESAGTLTLMGGDDGAVTVPYIDEYLMFRAPHLIPERLGVELRVSYTREATLKYYGLGNASEIPAGADPGADEFEHARTHPTVSLEGEYRDLPLVVTWGASYTHNWFELPRDGQLARDMQSADADVARLLGEARPHGVPELTVGVGWDTRDDEISPTRGVYATETVDVTPGTFGEAEYRFARSDTAVHVYVPLIASERRLVFAARAVGDLLFGDVPFYELPRFADTSAIGGAKGVRGVPAQRYYGKIKVFTNLELRSELFSFDLFGEPRRFGLVAFTDAGRVWADYRSNPELDGTGLGLKYGIGGGVRIASGKTFVLRADVAWSPDARPVSGYLLAGHLF